VELAAVAAALPQLGTSPARDATTAESAAQRRRVK
jgi:hypothetical protein